MDRTALDKHITTEPDNGFNDWSEFVFDKIPETEISGDEWDANEDFFFDGLDKLALAGKDGFPEEQFSADVLIKRYKVLKANPHLKTWQEVQDFVNERGY